MHSVQQGFCPVEGTRLYYEISGAGPLLVLLHGNPADHTSWDLQVEAFSKSFTVLRYDLRGFGQSPPADVPYSHAKDLAALLDYLHQPQTYLIGWSMGGGAVVNFTLNYPQQVKGIVLLNSSLGGFPYSENFTMSYFVNIIETARQQGVQEAKEKVMHHPIFASLQRNDKAKAILQQCLQHYSGWHWLNKDPGVPFQPPAIERLHEIHVPTLVIIGHDDIPDMQEISATLATNIPGAQKYIFAHAGHCPNLEEPDLFNSVVLDFLNSIEKGSKTKLEE